MTRINGFPYVLYGRLILPLFICCAWSLFRCLRISSAHAQRPLQCVWNLRLLIAEHALKRVILTHFSFQLWFFLGGVVKMGGNVLKTLLYTEKQVCFHTLFGF